MVDWSRYLLERVRHVAPGYYTERDGGLWYCVTPSHSSRVGEGFASRDDARRFICWLAGDPMPKGWTVTSSSRDLSADLDCGQGFPATIWLRSAREVFAQRPFGVGMGDRSRSPTPPDFTPA